MPLPTRVPGCARALCQGPSRAGRPSCLAAGWAKMMLGSLRFIGLGAGLPSVGLRLPECRVNLRPAADGTVGEDELRTGPWMGQEVEGRWTWRWWWWCCCGGGTPWCWWEGSSPRALSVAGWY